MNHPFFTGSLGRLSDRDEKKSVFGEAHLACGCTRSQLAVNLRLAAYTEVLKKILVRGSADMSHDYSSVAYALQLCAGFRKAVYKDD